MEIKSKKYIVRPNFSGSLLPLAIQQEAERSYSPGFKQGTSTIHTGITYEEQLTYLPPFIGVSPASPEFQTKVEDFFANYSVVIPYEGLELEGGVREDVAANVRIPINVRDYILVSMLLDDVGVAKNEDLDNEHFYKFVLIDKTAQEEADTAIYRVSIEATTAFIKLIDDATKKDYIKDLAIIMRDELDLTVTQLDEFNDEAIVQKLEAMKTKNPDRFLKLLKRDDINIRAIMLTALELNVLSRNGEAIYNGDVKIGDDLKGAIRTATAETELPAKLLAKINKVKKELRN